MADALTKAAPPAPAPLTDADLAKQIKAHLKEIEDTTNQIKQTVLKQALYLGDLLLQAKAKVGHGKFKRWLEKNCDLSERSAQRYMQLQEGWPKIEAWLKDNSARVADLSLRKAEQLTTITTNDGGSNASDIYDKAEKTLIKKLRDLSVEQAEGAAKETIKELNSTVATMKAGAKTIKAA
jgi:hypothetical protein